MSETRPTGTEGAAPARVPAGVPSGGQFKAGERAEGPRLTLVTLNPPGLDAEDAERFRRIDALIVEGATLTALDRATYTRLSWNIDDALDADDLSDRVHLPACLGCHKPWGTGFRCRICTNLDGDPFPMAMRATSRVRIAEEERERSRPRSKPKSKRTTARRRGPRRYNADRPFVR